MNDLEIEKRDGTFYVTWNGRAFEGSRLEDILETALEETEWKEDVERRLSTLFDERDVEQVDLGGSGEWWYANATIPIIKDYDNKYYNVESHDPVGAISALETAIENGWDHESGLPTIERILTWAWFV